MKVLTIASRKGGSGKSTLAAHAGVLAGKPDNPAVLVDLDPQRSQAEWWRQRGSPGSSRSGSGHSRGGAADHPC